jgi:hypothetical protein
LEKLGIPSMLISTEPFFSTCKGMAKVGGIPDQKFAVLPHPLGSLAEDALMERAESAAEQFVSIVVAP